MRILALDLGGRCGFAWTDTTECATWNSGVWSLTRSGEGWGRRFVRFRDLVLEVAPDRVVYELVRRHVGTEAAHNYGGYLGILTALCEEHGIGYDSIGVGTVKKHATGKGNARKPAMIAAAVERFARVPQDDNEADALWILDCHLAQRAA